MKLNHKVKLLAIAISAFALAGCNGGASSSSSSANHSQNGNLQLTNHPPADIDAGSVNSPSVLTADLNQDKFYLMATPGKALTANRKITLHIAAIGVEHDGAINTLSGSQLADYSQHCLSNMKMSRTTNAYGQARFPITIQDQFIPANKQLNECGTIRSITYSFSASGLKSTIPHTEKVRGVQMIINQPARQQPGQAAMPIVFKVQGEPGDRFDLSMTMSNHQKQQKGSISPGSLPIAIDALPQISHTVDVETCKVNGSVVSIPNQQYSCLVFISAKSLKFSHAKGLRFQDHLSGATYNFPIKSLVK